MLETVKLNADDVARRAGGQIHCLKEHIAAGSGRSVAAKDGGTADGGCSAQESGTTIQSQYRAGTGESGGNGEATGAESVNQCDLAATRGAIDRSRHGSGAATTKAQLQATALQHVSVKTDAPAAVRETARTVEVQQFGVERGTGGRNVAAATVHAGVVAGDLDAPHITRIQVDAGAGGVEEDDLPAAIHFVEAAGPIRRSRVIPTATQTYFHVNVGAGIAEHFQFEPFERSGNPGVDVHLPLQRAGAEVVACTLATHVDGFVPEGTDLIFGAGLRRSRGPDCRQTQGAQDNELAIHA